LNDESSDFIDETPKTDEPVEDADDIIELQSQKKEAELISLENLKLSKQENIILILGSEG